MLHPTLALTVDSAKNLAVWIAGGFVAMSVVSALVVRKLVAKLGVAIILLAVALAVWSQRANLVDCAARARASGTTAPVTCTFFGSDIEVAVP